MTMKCLLLAAAIAASGAPGAVRGETPDFYAHWGDGKAEVSSYRIVQSRYGEQREAYGVLVFVTEDINRKTFIKVESPTPAEDRIYTLKLNSVLKFTTGIYDYSVMTSVFSAVDGSGGDGAFELKKVTMSSQEWCGHVFEEVKVVGRELRGDLNSYFEREGKRDYVLDLPDSDFESEDNLLIRIRELRGPFMEPGERRQISLMPALWQLRTGHQERNLVSATLIKGSGSESGEGVDGEGGESLPAIRWEWKVEGGREKSVWVEEAYPHRILAWQDSDGNSGHLMKTLRIPYWQLHGLADEKYREELLIP